jgi:hypothetical protein
MDGVFGMEGAPSSRKKGFEGVLPSLLLVRG